MKQADSFQADQVEISAIRGGVSSVNSALIDERVSDEIFDAADAMGLHDLADFEREEVGGAHLSGAAMDVIKARAKLLGDNYPFEISGAQLTFSQGAPSFYTFCLATSVAAGMPQKMYQQLLREFERCATILLKCYLGDSAVGVRFGWPSEKDSLDPPTRFPAKVDWMKSRCGFTSDEWTLDVSEHLDTVRARAKDARIDVVVREPAFDSRPGGLTILGQCGCGKNDVDESSRKHEELSADWLSHFFGRTSTPSPFKAFLTSQHVVGESQLWCKQSESNSLFFDRVRLSILAKKCNELESRMVRLGELEKRIFNLAKAD